MRRCKKSALNITQYNGHCKAEETVCIKKLSHSNLNELKVLDQSFSTFFGSPFRSPAVPLQQTRRRLKITPKRGKRGRQASTESLFQEQLADPGAQCQGCKETDQPKSGSRGQKRSTNLTDEYEPQQKRPRTENVQEEAEPSNSSVGKAYLKVYEEGQLLGTGGFGRVFAGIRKEDGLPVAIKYVSKKKADEKLEIAGYGWLPLEVALMIIANTEPSFPNILQLLDWYDEPEQYIMILERPEPCEDLATFCRKHGGSLTEGVARNVIFQLIKALKHCKSRGIVHRDVKPENILIQTDTLKVKLFDFGCGDLVKDSYKDFAGTVQYTPPEWFKQRRYMADPATIWSVGVTLYRLVCGSLPFKTTKEIKNVHLHFTKSLSEECRHLIRWCLRAHASDRPSLEQIEFHDWFHLPGRAVHTTGQETGTAVLKSI